MVNTTQAPRRHRNKIGRQTWDDRLVVGISLVAVVVFAALCITPFLYVLSHSFTPYDEYLQAPTRLIPREVTLDAYEHVMSVRLIRSSYLNTVFIVVVGTAINLTLLLLTAYPLTKRDLKGRNIVLTLIVFTMFFSGGIIPKYYVVQELGLMNRLWSLILPNAISTFNLLLMKSFMTSTIPASLEESAEIDGANAFTILFLIIAPLSKPALATFLVFHSVGHWNAFFEAVLYISSRGNWPLTLVLREVVIENNTDLVVNAATQRIVGSDADTEMNPYTIKMATVLFATLPILVVYPFLQRFFVKGMMIGAIKQ